MVRIINVIQDEETEEVAAIGDIITVTKSDGLVINRDYLVKEIDQNKIVLIDVKTQKEYYLYDFKEFRFKSAADHLIGIKHIRISSLHI